MAKLCFFTMIGAVEILKNLDDIDFSVFYSGRICWDEVSRVRRLARTDCLKIPHFAQDMSLYKKRLRQMARLNGLNEPSNIFTTIVPMKTKRTHSHKKHKGASKSSSSLSFKDGVCDSRLFPSISATPAVLDCASYDKSDVMCCAQLVSI